VFDICALTNNKLRCVLILDSGQTPCPSLLGQSNTVSVHIYYICRNCNVQGEFRNLWADVALFFFQFFSIRSLYCCYHYLFYLNDGVRPVVVEHHKPPQRSNLFVHISFISLVACDLLEFHILILFVLKFKVILLVLVCQWGEADEFNLVRVAKKYFDSKD